MAAEAGDRAAHREMGRVVDVEPVDVGDRRRPDADRDRAPPDDRGQPLALERGHRLRVADAMDPVAVGRHDHGRGDHRTGRGGDTDLVHADDAARAVPPQGAFPAEGGDDDGHRSTAYRARSAIVATMLAACDWTMQRPSRQVDVFTTEPGLGNALAVVLDGDGLSTEAMQRFARWTNLSETTFVRPVRRRRPRTTPSGSSRRRRRSRSPATRRWGRATRGSRRAACRATRPRIVQECGAGLVEVRRDGGRARVRARRRCCARGPVDDADLDRDRRRPGHRRVTRSSTRRGRQRARLDGGPARERGARPRRSGSARRSTLDLGIVGPYPAGAPSRSRCARCGRSTARSSRTRSTGSLNASVAAWLLDTGRVTRAVRRDAGRGDRPGGAILDHAGPRRDRLDRRTERDARPAGPVDL